MGISVEVVGVCSEATNGARGVAGRAMASFGKIRGLPQAARYEWLAAADSRAQAGFTGDAKPHEAAISQLVH